uniref:SGNH domain-containing protein n=1 Tax=Syphacia muris TaxID=451379 RepID=A0A0N5AZP0_9BILA
MQTFVVVILLFANAHCTGRNIAKMFSQDSFFHEQFIHFVQQQERHWQNGGEELEFDRNADLLRECSNIDRATLEHVDNIAIGDIAYYTELGDLSYYCEHNFTKLYQGDIEECNHPGYDLPISSLDKYLRIFNSNITIIPVPPSSNLTRQAQDFAEELQKRKDAKLKWKLVVIMLGHKDHVLGSQLEIGPTIMEAVQRLYSYERTFIVVARIADATMWNNARHAHKACQMLLSESKNNNILNEQESLIWTQIASHLQSKQRKLFGVEILSLNATLDLIQSTSTTDLTAIGYDCYHLSAKGLSMFHTTIWNLILTQDNLRSNQFRPRYQPPRCADPVCPFIRTRNNSALCNWNFPKTSRNGLKVEEWIAIGIFATAVTLCAILLVALCCGRGRDQVVTEALKPVGADWSCITRFIDEDSAGLNLSA